MPIKITNNLFNIETKNTLYQMKVDKYNVLKHLWYGKKTDMDMEYLEDYPDVGFSGQIYDAGFDKTYSHDTIPQEYSTVGTGDFRTPSLVINYNNGTSAVDLRYKSHKVYKGKYKIEGLPYVYSNGDDNVETLEIVLVDRFFDIEVILKYGVFFDNDIITRSVVVRNNTDNNIVINKCSSMCLDIIGSFYDVIHFHGRHASERNYERTSLVHGKLDFSNTRGTSSHQQNPSIILADSSCTEDFGECFGACLMYSGSFKTEVELDQLNQTRLVMGINPDLFSWTLKSGEEFSSPEVIMSFSSNGLSTLSHNFHNIIRNNVCRGKYKLKNRPVLINNWEATYFDFNEEKIYEIARGAKELGVDMIVMDDGWFGKRNGEQSGLGDWFVNNEKIRGGLKALVDKINDLDMKFGIWFEPEMISEDSELYRSHPDWAIKIPNRDPIRSRCQLLLDITREDAREYLYESIKRILENTNVSYIKWDFNRSINDWYSYSLDKNTQKEMPHRFVLALYSILERINTDFPDILIEGCSGGGGRFDAGMLYYTPQIWCSDNTDAYERCKIQYGTSFFYPISTVGSHVSAVPNHQTGRVTSLNARATVAMAGSFGYELDLNTLTDDEKDEIKNQIKEFKKYNYLIHNGDYFRLSNPNSDNYSIWEFASDDEVLVQGLIFRTEPNSLRYNIKLKGLDENAQYILESDNSIYTGISLMNGGILLPKSIGDYFPINLHFRKIRRD